MSGSRHAIVDPESVASLGARLFNVNHVELTPVITQGMETQAFRVTDGREVGCLRIGSSLRSFRKDAWAHDCFGEFLPVPRVWELGELPDGSAFCLTSWAEGRSLQDLTIEEIAGVTPQVFDAWTRLQAGATDEITGFGDIDPDTLAGPFDSQADRLKVELVAARRWSSDWVERRSGVVSEILETYEGLMELCPSERSVIHGDWGTNNILASADRVTSVLDWEAAGIGDPLQDVAGRFWAFWPPVSDCVTALASYADRHLSHLPNYQERVLCYDLQAGLSEITACLDGGESEFAVRCLHRCMQLIREHRGRNR